MAVRALAVIPAYNEAETIEAVVRKAMRHADVLVVNDASRDGTGQIAESIPGCAVIHHARNTHIPQGIQDGFRYALERDYDYVVTLDAGMSHDPEALRDLIAMPASDLVLSCRTQTVNVPWYRRVLSTAAASLVNSAIRRQRWKFWEAGYRDVTSGYRRYSRRAMEAVLSAPLVCRSFDFHLEALAVVHYAGLKITEFPITYVFSNSSLTWRVVRQAVKTWLRLTMGLHRPTVHQD